MKVGLVGCGNIGTVIAKAFDEGKIAGELVSVYDTDNAKPRELLAKLKKKPRIAKSFEELLKGTDIIVEAASQNAVREYALKVISAGKSILIMSSGALADERLLERLTSQASKRNVKIYIPSGAVCGIDGVKAAALDGVDSVLLQTTKPPKSMPEFKNLRRRSVIFDGPAIKAVKLFPANVNVSAVLSLAGIGAKKTRVKIIVDPKTKKGVYVPRTNKEKKDQRRVLNFK
jgi:aspartate dehydrogenase